MSLRRRTRPLRHGLAYLTLRALVAGLRLLPFRAALTIGATLGRLIGAFARRDSARMAQQLATLSNPPTVRACWGDLGRRFVELACAERALARFDWAPGAEAVAQATLATGRGAVVCVTHLGNWELLGAALARWGYPVFAVAARHRAGPLHRWLHRQRLALGVHTYGPGQARALRRHLAQGQAVALFIDQNTGERGRSIMFFGQPAPTPTTVERLADAAQAPLVLAWTRRDADGRHRVHLEPVAPGPRSLDALTARVESLVRQTPAQWVWIHRRWAGQD